MPILPAEPDLFPEDLWDRGPDTVDGQRWWCLHTKPRQEKSTARHLRDRQIAYYAPQILHESRTPLGRKIRSFLPLFPSYVFMIGDEHQRLEAFRSNTLVNVLEVIDQASLIRDLRQIRQLLASGLSAAREHSHPIGVWVRICSGPLSGIVGTVVRRGPRDRFIALVSFLGSGATVDLEDWQVERIAPPAPHLGPSQAED
jgi:transcription antitermination factor NusG